MLAVRTGEFCISENPTSIIRKSCTTQKLTPLAVRHIAGRYFTIKSSMNEAKFDALGQYRTSALFSDAERAALDYVTELTRDKRVDPEIFSRLADHYSERQICEIVWLVASERFYNMTNIGLNVHSDMLCDISKRSGAA
jgi:hypothetical protein